MPLIDQRTTFTIGESTPYVISFTFNSATGFTTRYVFTPFQPHDLRDVSVRVVTPATAASALDFVRVPDGQTIASGTSLLSEPIAIGLGQSANTIARAVLAADTTVQQTSSVAMVVSGDPAGFAGLCISLTFTVLEP